MPLSRSLQRRIVRLGVTTLGRLLTFKLEVDISRYMADRNARDFRSFEEEVAYASEIHGAGVVVVPEDLTRTLGPGEEGFFRTEVPLGAHEVGAFIASFPLEAAAASYAFTVLEIFGNEVASLTSPTGLDRNKAWHEGVKGFADLRDPIQLERNRAAFGKHFDIGGTGVPAIAARRMVGVKRVRNDFAHDGDSFVSFDSFLEDVIALVCHIVFMVTDEKRLSVYPFEDHFDTFTPQS